MLRLIALCFLLLSCSQSFTYNYLVLHPSKLEKAYSQCQLKDSPDCPEIKRAAHDMGELMYEQASEPATFGKRIMEQQLLVKEMNIRDKAYDDALLRLNMMYAVLALHSPE